MLGLVDRRPRACAGGGPASTHHTELQQALPIPQGGSRRRGALRGWGIQADSSLFGSMPCLPSLGREPPAALGADPAQGTVASLPLPGSSSVPLCESHHSLMFSLSRAPSPGPL